MTISRMRHASGAVRRTVGFTLIELMVAVTLGLLLTLGILQLFDGTSRTNKLQNGLARLQENGRYAVTRIEADLRMLGGQRCSNFAGNAITDGAGGNSIWSARAPISYVTSLSVPDMVAPLTGATPYRVDPSVFVRGYECGGGGCSNIPALGSYAAEGLAAGRRVPNSDVLTIRYQAGTGWPVRVGGCSAAGDFIADGDVINLVNQTGNDPAPATTPSAILVSSCAGSAILPVSAMTGAAPSQPSAFTIGPAGSLFANAAPSGLCQGNATTDVRAFSMDDFVTVSYFLVYRQNSDPDAGVRSLVPTLVRRVNGGPAQDLVQGVDQLDFVFGALTADGSLRFLTANQVDAEPGSNCTPPGDGVANGPGCLWRDIRTVEAHLLVNSGDQVFGLDDISRSFRYQGTTTAVAADGSTLLPSGQVAGSMLRREFIAQTMIRNRNP
ncbi:PilW family protein [Dokdonella sp.]|uniref:PilW family protein n=1 Tax=Dokdonella sp. TaxID=2291710 RepID=UPI0025BAAE84|nr:PilW family protein [Dokdonella sp.]MBX3692090.1 PilW family protein [Dokdonella sp.]MCW5566950.1 PilW family protein [Dokdonella sp.]